MMGPSCAVADVNNDQVTLYTGTQGSFETRDAVAELLGLPEKNVRVLWREASGSYGRLGADDAAEDAALLSRAVGKPVRVQWMRDDEHGWEPKGPAQLDLARAGVDAQGKIIAWDFADRGFPLTAASGRGLRLLASRQIGMKADRRRQLQRHSGRSVKCIRSKIKNARAVGAVDTASRRNATAHRLPARAGRYRALLRQRILYR